MPGQRESRFDTGPGFNTPTVGNPAPTINMPQIKPRAAQYDTSAQPVSGLSDALAGFFNVGAKTVQTLDEIDHRQELVKIERENKALQDLASADQAAGIARRPEFTDRQAYNGVYTDAAANESARKGIDAVRTRLRGMKLDGTEDPRAIAEEVFRSEFGPRGTGDPEFDASWVNTFRRGVEPLVVHSNEQVAQTVEANRLETIKSNAINTLLDADKATPGALDRLQADVLTATRGNQALADRQMESIVTSAYMNDGNTTAILNSLKKNGYAERNPDSYLRMSEQAFHRTNAIKTWQAGTEVEQWGNDLMEAERNNHGFVPLNELLEFAHRAYLIDSKHGVGSARFTERLQGLWAKSAQSQAEVNIVLQSLLTGRPATLLAAENGAEISKVMEKHFDPAVAQYVQMRPEGFPNLGKTPRGQMLNPLASAGAAQEYGALIGRPEFVNAVPDGQSSTYKTMFGNALLGTDPQLATNAVHGLARYEALNGPEKTRKLLRSDDEWNAYVAAKTSGKEYGVYFKARAENPSDTKLLDDANGGRVQWDRLVNKPGKRDEVEAEVIKAQDSALVKAVGRDGFFFDPKVAMSDRMRNSLSAKMAQFLAEQKRTGGSLGVEDAAKHAVVSLQTEAVAIPGQDGSLVLYPKPNDNSGSVRDKPIKLPNGKLAYLPGKVNNFADETEDTLKTWREDIAAISKVLPTALTWNGVEHDPAKLYLDGPGASEVPGLHTVLSPGGQRAMFVPGQTLEVIKTTKVHEPLILKGRSGIKTEKVGEQTPTDPVEFERYMSDKLPPGFHLMQQHNPNGAPFYVLAYGFRLKKDRAWLDAENATRAAEFERAKNEELEYQKNPIPPTHPLGMGDPSRLSIPPAGYGFRNPADVR
jgi:hypothetical protein